MSVLPARVLSNAIRPLPSSADHAGSRSSAVGVFVSRRVLPFVGSRRKRSRVCPSAKTIGPTRPGNVPWAPPAVRPTTTAARTTVRRMLRLTLRNPARAHDLLRREDLLLEVVELTGVGRVRQRLHQDAATEDVGTPARDPVDGVA